MKKPNIQFTKPYSKGQITIPLQIRKYLDIDEETWLFMTVEDKKLVIKPVKEKELARQGKSSIPSQDTPQMEAEEYAQMVVKEVKGEYGEKIIKENEQVKREIEEKLEKLDL